MSFKYGGKEEDPNSGEDEDIFYNIRFYVVVLFTGKSKTLALDEVMKVPSVLYCMWC